jgi:predicted ATPase
VQNFRGFVDLKLDELARITLFAGKNNTGKSAVLEALFLLCSGPLAAQNAMGALRTFRGDNSVPLDASTDSTPWDPLFFNFDASKTITIGGKRNSEAREVQLSRIRNVDSVSFGPSSKSYSRQSLVHYQRGDRAEEYIQTVDFQVTPVTDSGGMPGIQQQNITAQLRLQPPAEAGDLAYFMSARLRANQQELANRYSQLRRKGDERDLIDVLRIVEPRLHRLEVLVEQGLPALHFELGSSGRSFPMSTLGEGTSSVVDFVTSIQLAKEGTVLIDEMENGIHHSILKDIWTQLHRAAERSNVQIVATTHSQECVEAAQAALSKRPSELQLIRLRRPKDNGPVEAVNYDAEALSGAIEGGLDVR